MRQWKLKIDDLRAAYDNDDFVPASSYLPIFNIKILVKLSSDERTHSVSIESNCKAPGTQ